MTVKFTLGGFLQPAAILKYRQLFERGQWLSPAELEELQRERMQSIIAHAFREVPYYQGLFQSLKLTPSDFRKLDDLQKLPPLTKDTVRTEAARLRARNARQFRPQLYSTSGSTGASHHFLLDRATNALEFAYYWRYWNWAGYRLGDPFAEFSTSYFSQKRRSNTLAAYQPLARRLLLNSLAFTESIATAHLQALEQHGARFLKGLPSVLGGFAQLLRRSGTTPPKLSAIFSTGELLLPTQRRVIEQCFGAPVYDSYGQMERLVAISECPARRMHVNADYGLLESLDGRALGTSLHNYSMPLLRYELGDVITLAPPNSRCSCGRGFPLASAILGRSTDTIEFQDGRVVPTLFLALRGVAGIAMCQFVVHAKQKLCAYVVPTEQFTNSEQSTLRTQLKWHVGPSVVVEINQVAPHQLRRDTSGKFKMVVTDD